MSQKVRRGNDIHITWTLTDGEGNPYIVEGRDVCVSMIAVNVYPPVRVPVSDLTIKDNVISFMYYGKDQRETGMYCLELVENVEQESMTTFDVEDAFTLVHHSWQVPVSGPRPQGISAISIEIQS